MRSQRASRLCRVAVLGAVTVLLTACAGEDEPRESRTPQVPAGLDLPAGVVLTEAGAQLSVGESATVVLELGDGAAGVATVELTGVRRGDIDDFEYFSLDERSRTSTPYYVEVSVTNEGPAGLGGISLPLLAHTDAETVYPASELVGTFEPCPTAPLPEQFLAGETAEQCYIHLVPEGEALEIVDLRPGEAEDAVRWMDPVAVDEDEEDDSEAE